MALTKIKYSNSLNELFRAGNYKELINFPPSFEDLGMDGHRILLNYQGMAFAALGAPLKAKMTYEKALNYGENIQLLRDLACTYYQLEEYQAWRDSYIKLKETLKTHLKSLDFDTRFSCSIILAKFLEEEGRLGQSLNIYEELYQQPKCSDKNSKQFYLLAPQLLRLKSQLPASEELSHLYTQLLSYDQNSQSSYINIEIEHSLMLAELSLIGTQHAWTRVEKIIANKKAMIHDKRLFYIDFLEETILHNQKVDNIYTHPGTDVIEDFSKYEDCVFSLVKKRGLSNSVINLNTVAREVPLGSYLKLLNLYAVKSQDKNIQSEYKNKISLIIAGFESADRAFWIKRTQQFSSDNYTELFLDLEKRVLNFHSKFMDVSRKKQSLLLLKLLANKSSWNIDDAIHSIWNTSYSPEHFNRLRMSVHRTNQLLFELTTKEKCIELSGEHLNLHPSIKLIPEGQQTTPVES